jgi:hypothetical protein
MNSHVDGQPVLFVTLTQISCPRPKCHIYSISILYTNNLDYTTRNLLQYYFAFVLPQTNPDLAEFISIVHTHL